MTDSTTPTPVPSPKNEDRHVMEPEIHQDLLDPDGAATSDAGVPGQDENAPGFLKPKRP